MSATPQTSQTARAYRFIGAFLAKVADYLDAEPPVAVCEECVNKGFDVEALLTELAPARDKMSGSVEEATTDTIVQFFDRAHEKLFPKPKPPPKQGCEHDLSPSETSHAQGG